MNRKFDIQKRIFRAIRNLNGSNITGLNRDKAEYRAVIKAIHDIQYFNCIMVLFRPQSMMEMDGNASADAY